MIALRIALSVVSYRSFVATTTGADWVRHTYKVIDRLAGLQAAMQDIEAGYRGLAARHGLFTLEHL